LLIFLGFFRLFSIKCVSFKCVSTLFSRIPFHRRLIWNEFWFWKIYPKNLHLFPWMWISWLGLSSSSILQGFQEVAKFSYFSFSFLSLSIQKRFEIDCLPDSRRIRNLIGDSLQRSSMNASMIMNFFNMLMKSDLNMHKRFLPEFENEIDSKYNQVFLLIKIKFKWKSMFLRKKIEKLKIKLLL
jgi:hypothetical protein